MYAQRVLTERQSRVEHLREQLRLEEEAAAALASGNAALRQQLAPSPIPEVGMLHYHQQVLKSWPASCSLEALDVSALLPASASSGCC